MVRFDDMDEVLAETVKVARVHELQKAATLLLNISFTGMRKIDLIRGFSHEFRKRFQTREQQSDALHRFQSECLDTLTALARLPAIYRLGASSGHLTEGRITRNASVATSETAKSGPLNTAGGGTSQQATSSSYSLNRAQLSNLSGSSQYSATLARLADGAAAINAAASNISTSPCVNFANASPSFFEPLPRGADQHSSYRHSAATRGRAGISSTESGASQWRSLFEPNGAAGNGLDPSSFMQSFSPAESIVLPHHQRLLFNTARQFISTSAGTSAPVCAAAAANYHASVPPSTFAKHVYSSYNEAVGNLRQHFRTDMLQQTDASSPLTISIFPAPPNYAAMHKHIPRIYYARIRHQSRVPFYRSVEVLVPPVRLQSIMSVKSAAYLMGVLRFEHDMPTSCLSRNGSTLTSNSDLLIRFFKIDENESQLDTLPPNVTVEVRGVDTTTGWNTNYQEPSLVLYRTALVRFKKLKPKHEKPIVIPNDLAMRARVIEVVVTYTPSESDYEFAVGIFRGQTVSIEDEVNSIRQMSLHASVSRHAILKELKPDAGGDDDISAAEVSSLPLKCPISKSRIKVPCRSMACTVHHTCDAFSFLQMNFERPTWRCFLCNKDVYLQDLRYESFIGDLLDDAHGEHVSAAGGTSDVVNFVLNEAGDGLKIKRELNGTIGPASKSKCDSSRSTGRDENSTAKKSKGTVAEQQSGNKIGSRSDAPICLSDSDDGNEELAEAATVSAADGRKEANKKKNDDENNNIALEARFHDNIAANSYAEDRTHANISREQHSPIVENVDMRQRKKRKQQRDSVSEEASIALASDAKKILRSAVAVLQGVEIIDLTVSSSSDEDDVEAESSATTALNATANTPSFFMPPQSHALNYTTVDRNSAAAGSGSCSYTANMPHTPLFAPAVLPPPVVGGPSRSSATCFAAVPVRRVMSGFVRNTDDDEVISFDTVAANSVGAVDAISQSQNYNIVSPHPQQRMSVSTTTASTSQTEAANEFQRARMAFFHNNYNNHPKKSRAVGAAEAVDLSSRTSVLSRTLAKHARQRSYKQQRSRKVLFCPQTNALVVNEIAQAVRATKVATLNQRPLSGSGMLSSSSSIIKRRCVKPSTRLMLPGKYATISYGKKKKNITASDSDSDSDGSWRHVEVSNRRRRRPIIGRNNDDGDNYDAHENQLEENFAQLTASRRAKAAKIVAVKSSADAVASAAAASAVVVRMQMSDWGDILKLNGGAQTCTHAAPNKDAGGGAKTRSKCHVKKRSVIRDDTTTDDDDDAVVKSAAAVSDDNCFKTITSSNAGARTSSAGRRRIRIAESDDDDDG